MNVKTTVFFVLVALASLLHSTAADFFYNRPTIKDSDLGRLHLKCVPGRTVMKVEEKPAEIIPQESGASDEFVKRRFSEADADERCRICICSSSGRDEFCFSRLSGTVNECVRMSRIMSGRIKGTGVFDIKRDLPNSIRRVGGGDVRRGARRHLNLQQKKCVPFVSQYSDCNEFNQCEGCTKCMCSTESTWECRSVRICSEHDEETVDDDMYEAAIQKLEFEMENFKKKQQKYAPSLNVLFSEGMDNKTGKSLFNFWKLDQSGQLADTLGVNGQSRQYKTNFGKNKRQREAEFAPAPVITRLVPEPPGPKRQDTEDLLGYVFTISRQQQH